MEEVALQKVFHIVTQEFEIIIIFKRIREIMTMMIFNVEAQT